MGVPDVELRHVVREQRLKQVKRLHSLDLELAHVRDVEDPAVGPDGAMLGNDAVVLNRHVPAGERHHPGAKGEMPLEERRSLKRLCHPSDGNEKPSPKARLAFREELEWGPPRPFPA